MNYRCNAQGQLTHINDPSLAATGGLNDQTDDVFGQQLVYFNTNPSQDFEYDQSNSAYTITPKYDGNISATLWNAKDPDEDGTTLSQNSYIYEYDDFGQMTGGFYAADDPAMPGEYNEKVGFFNETIEYDLGGNMKALGRNSYISEQTIDKRIDSLAYTYHNNGFRTKKITDVSVGGHTPQFKHFVDQNTTTEYTYDLAGRTLTDKNRKVQFHYNQLGLPRVISKDMSDYSIAFTYDAAGNKLQKKMSHLEQMSDPSGNTWYETKTLEIDYIGNFVFENGELKMIYHPEGVIRRTPANASNETDYVYDYFIKDYLGNVRVVLTEEDATIDSTKFLATMEDVYRQIEINNFDNIDETTEELPTGYPINGSVELNERIALLSAANGTEIGPSMVLPVRRGDRVSLRTEYFYSEGDQTETYDNFGLLVNEVLLALASSGAGVLQLSEAQLLDIATGSGNYGQAVSDFMSSNFDTTDVTRPHAYLIWVLYDNSMKLLPQGSGVLRVTDPNDLKSLLQDQISIVEDGYLHAYVANNSAKPLSFDNFLVTHIRGKTRQINHYYPYGLSISGLGGDYNEYLNKYTGKELQTGEFDPAVSTGLEMFDFHARFYDPQLGRWFTPDPAEQFHNPYLAMGNNPVMYVDPDGEFAFVPLLVAMAYGAAIGAGTAAVVYSAQVGMGKQQWDWNSFGQSVAFGAVGGALGGGLGHIGAQLGTFGQSLGYNVLSNVASNSATTAAFGGDLTFGSLAGSVVGGFVGNGIGNFNGVSGSAFRNIGAELAFGAAKGAATGFFGSGVGIAADGMTGNLHSNAGASLWNGTKNGAIAGGTVAGLNIASMGAAYKPNRQYGDFGREGPVYRRGTFLTRALFGGSGVTIGRNLVINRVKEPPPGYNYLDPDTGWPMIPSKMTQEIEAHETYHYIQQRQMGFANFYSRISGEYIKYGQINTYCTPGTLEWDADMFGIQQLGNSIYR